MKTYICAVCGTIAYNEETILPDGWFRHKNDSTADFPLCSDECSDEFFRIDSDNPAEIAATFRCKQ